MNKNLTLTERETRLPRPLESKQDALEFAHLAISNIDIFAPYRDDVDVALAVLKACDDHHTMVFASRTLLDNKDFAVAACEYYGGCFEFLSDRLKKDKDVIKVALTSYGQAYHSIPTAMKEDREIVITMVSHYGPYLQDVVLYLRDDKEIALAAVKNNGYSIRYASQRLQEDFDVAMTAVTENPTVFENLPPSLQDNKHIFLAALENGGEPRLLSHASENIYKLLSQSNENDYIPKLKSWIERETLQERFQGNQQPKDIQAL